MFCGDSVRVTLFSIKMTGEIAEYRQRWDELSGK